LGGPQPKGKLESRFSLIQALKLEIKHPIQTKFSSPPGNTHFLAALLISWGAGDPGRAPGKGVSLARGGAEGHKGLEVSLAWAG